MEKIQVGSQALPEVTATMGDPPRADLSALALDVPVSCRDREAELRSCSDHGFTFSPRGRGGRPPWLLGQFLLGAGAMCVVFSVLELLRPSDVSPTPSLVL